MKEEVRQASARQGENILHIGHITLGTNVCQILAGVWAVGRVDFVGQLGVFFECVFVEDAVGDPGPHVPGQLALPQGQDDVRTTLTVEFMFANVTD